MQHALVFSLYLWTELSSAATMVDRTKNKSLTSKIFSSLLAESFPATERVTFTYKESFLIKNLDENKS